MFDFGLDFYLGGYGILEIFCSDGCWISSAYSYTWSIHFEKVKSLLVITFNECAHSDFMLVTRVIIAKTSQGFWHRSLSIGKSTWWISEAVLWKSCHLGWDMKCEWIWLWRQIHMASWIHEFEWRQFCMYPNAKFLNGFMNLGLRNLCSKCLHLKDTKSCKILGKFELLFFFSVFSCWVNSNSDQVVPFTEFSNYASR